MTARKPSIEQKQLFGSHFARSIDRNTFVDLSIQHSSETNQQPGRIKGRIIDLHGGSHLSLTLSWRTRDVTRNLPLAEAPLWLRSELDLTPRSALLRTTEHDWQWQRTPKGIIRIVRHPSSRSEQPARTHDRKIARALDLNAIDWLIALGVRGSDGGTRGSMIPKEHQINRYLEILGHELNHIRWPKNKVVRVVDMGSGKGYLTFALWHGLHRQRGLETHVTGIERQPDLVRQCTDVAHSIQARGLDFQCGSITEWPAEPVDILVALHACNIATDEAIERGIQAGAQLILVAPCCHQDLRKKIQDPPLFAPILSHGLLKERFSEWLTDSLRVLRLEEAGYRVKAIEFVSSEHTAKNLLLMGTRIHSPAAATAASAQAMELRHFFGLT